jgi:hypothetical protein
MRLANPARGAETLDWLDAMSGWLGVEVYSTAWVGMVPDYHDPGRPAWPQTIDFVRKQQLADGSWGTADIYFAHERTLATLSALQVLTRWPEDDPQDAERVWQGLKALAHMANDLPGEAHPTMGFDLLFPFFRNTLAELLDDFDSSLWPPLDPIQQLVQAAISSGPIEPDKPQGWWWFLEMLPGERLAAIDEAILNRHGGIVISPAATAAYLAARRQAGADCPRAAAYLEGLLEVGGGAVPGVWPADSSDQIWGLYALSLAGIDPHCAALTPVIEALSASWQRDQAGLSNASCFPVNDGDDTWLGYAVLEWAGRTPDSDQPGLDFWDPKGYFRGFCEEPARINSVNLHALIALRAQAGFPHRELAAQTADFLIERMGPQIPFDDQYHLSPFYATHRALIAFAGLRRTAAQHCLDFILSHQHPDGGWGWFGPATREETAYCVLALHAAKKAGLAVDHMHFAQANRFFKRADLEAPYERLWIAKSLYALTGSIRAAVYAAQHILNTSGGVCDE